MNSTNLCRCCLLRTSVKDMKTPYTRLGITEIFSNMLEECFQIHLSLNADDCGICDVCVARLRDARDFKLQVQRSQIKLQETPVHGKDEELSLSIKPELVEVNIMTMTNEIGYENTMVKTELSEGNSTSLSRQSVALARPEFATSSVKREKQTSIKTKELSNKQNDNTTKLGDKKFSCNICPKKFPLRNDLTDHLRTHTGQNICHICDKTFTTTKSLTRHIKLHTELRPFSCEICNKAFKTEELLKKHTLRLHIGERAYSCNKCHKKYTQNSSLERHMQSHTKLRPNK